MSSLLKGNPRSLRRLISHALKEPGFTQSMTSLTVHSPKTVVNALLPYLCHADPVVKWNSVLGVGWFTKLIAEKDRERARVVMRRLIWTLNEECGGIGWGTPEGMAEIMTQDSLMAKEYVSMLISFMEGEGNFLEFEPLQAGVLWGLGRLSSTQTALLQEKRVETRLPFYFKSPDASVRGLAAWVSGCLLARDCRSQLESLTTQKESFLNFISLSLNTTSIAELALEAIKKLEAAN